MTEVAFTKHFALRNPTSDTCEFSITSEEDGHKVYSLSYAQLRLLTLEGARILSGWRKSDDGPKGTTPEGPRTAKKKA